MKLSLNLIQSSPNPVRTTWDEEKLNELAQSLKEQGQIQPIKVRPVVDVIPCRYHGIDYLDPDYSTYDDLSGSSCDRCLELSNAYVYFDDETHEDGEYRQMPVFEIVYGHRRTEAARRAGMQFVEAIVEDIDDKQALIQALIENVQREDMTDFDTAKGLSALQVATGWSLREVEERGIITRSRASALLSLLKQPDEIRHFFENVPQRDNTVTIKHIEAVAPVINDDALKIAVIKKAAEEQLSSAQTRKVAEAVAAAPGEDAKQILLNRPFSQLTHDPEFIKERAERYGAHDPIYNNMRQSSLNDEWQTTPEVNNMIGLMRSWMGSLTEFRKADELGKMSPEARGFMARRVRQFATALIEWADKLEEKNG